MAASNTCGCWMWNCDERHERQHDEFTAMLVRVALASWMGSSDNLRKFAAFISYAT